MTSQMYSVGQARGLVPQLRAVLLQLAVQKRRHEAAHARLHALLGSDGIPRRATDVQGREREIREIGEGMQSLLGHLDELGVQVRDLEMGLVDLPGERDGRPIWLCWRLSDPELAFWHATDEGYASRKPL